MCESKNPKAVKAVVASSSVARRLWRLLQRSSRNERLKLLRHFSESQRGALERWILSHPKGTKAAAASKKRSKRPRSGYVHPRSLSGVHGIESHSRQGKLQYRAVVKLGPFRIMTGYCKDLLLAKQQLQVLRNICGEAPMGPTEPEVVQGLRHALAQAKTSDLQLRFFALLPCRQLKTPCLKLEERGIEAGLRAWQELRALLLVPPEGGTHTSGATKTSASEVWRKAQCISDDVWAFANGSRKRVVKRREAPRNFSQRHMATAQSGGSSGKLDRQEAEMSSAERTLKRLLRKWHPAPVVSFLDS